MSLVHFSHTPLWGSLPESSMLTRAELGTISVPGLCVCVCPCAVCGRACGRGQRTTVLPTAPGPVVGVCVRPRQPHLSCRDGGGLQRAVCACHSFSQVTLQPVGPACHLQGRAPSFLSDGGGRSLRWPLLCPLPSHPLLGSPRHPRVDSTRFVPRIRASGQGLELRVRADACKASSFPAVPDGTPEDPAVPHRGGAEAAGAEPRCSRVVHEGER